MARSRYDDFVQDDRWAACRLVGRTPAPFVGSCYRWQPLPPKGTKGVGSLQFAPHLHGRNPARPDARATCGRKIPLKSGQRLCYAGGESEAARRTLLRGRLRARRRPAAVWQFAFCAPESRVRNPGLLFIVAALRSRGKKAESGKLSAFGLAMARVPSPEPPVPSR